MIAGRTICPLPYPWDTDFDDLAETIWRLRENLDRVAVRIIISGFMQTNGSWNGCVKLWNKCYESLHEPTVLRVGDVRIAAYSWGATGAVVLSRGLAKRGVPVKSITMSDGVYRHHYFAGNWRAFFPAYPIHVPANVGEVFTFVQRNNWPRGHRVVAKGSDTTIHEPIVVDGVTHQFMDDLGLWHDKVLEEFVQ